ncbi:MAG: hypothetical protein LAO76_20270 [Acidobacteriia bacterium]|nr:hypothetical protein [Terriglobia bacterium]
MATCVFDEIESKLEAGTGEKDGKKEALTSSVNKNEKDAPSPTASTPQGKTWEPSDLLLAGIVVAIVILSCTALVYAARH